MLRFFLCCNVQILMMRAWRRRRMMHNMTVMHYVMTMVNHTTMMGNRVMGLGHRGGCHGKQNDNQ